MELQFPPLPLLFAFLLLIAVLRRASKSKAHVAAAELPPGPWKLPFIGSLHHLAGDLPQRRLRDLARRHGPVMSLKFGQIDFTILSSREAAEECMKTHDLNFANRPILTAPYIVCYGCTDIAFSPYNNYWRQLRKICVTELLSAKRVKSFAAIREEEVSKIVQEISAEQGRPVNLSVRFLDVTNNIVSRAAFGLKCDQKQRFMAAVKEAMKLANGLNVADLFPSLKFVDVISGVKGKLVGIHRQVDEILGEIVKEHEANRNGPEDEDLMDVLLRFKERADLEVPMTVDNVKAVIVDLFVGGTETSSSTIDWAMSEMIKNPRTLEKAQEEVRKTLTGKTKVGESDIAELYYLKNVVKETLRLHPPVPLLVPRVGKETVKIQNYTIPVGTRVIINAWALGRDPSYWGDAETFRPERFEGNPRTFTGNDFEFIPFGAGRRICPGLTFGVASVEHALAQLLFYFDWKLPNGMAAEELDMTETFGASAARKNELHLVPIPRIPVPSV